MPRGLQLKGKIRRNKLLHVAIKLFLQNGYDKTTTASIAKGAGMSPSSFFAAFENKEALLLTLVEIMFEGQFDRAEQIMGASEDPLLLYGIETALQLYITEISEPLRELYVVAYSLNSTSEYICTQTAARLQPIFAVYQPDAQAMDFYEMEVASGGVMCAFMAKKCDLYFNMERKLKRFLECSLTLYAVPKAKQQQVIAAVLDMDLKSIAEKIIDGMLEKADRGINLIADE